MSIPDQHQNLIINPSLNLEEKVSLINREFSMLIEHFDQKAMKAKSNFHFYKYISIILAGATSIASSLQLIYTSVFPLWVVPVISALATVAVAILGASSSQKIWINSRTTAQQLQVERFLFNQQAGRYNKLAHEDSIRLFSERMIQVWNEGHGKWEQTVNEG